jgi:hypothetical protein
MMRRQIETEDRHLHALAETIRESFEEASFALNISALPGEIDVATTPTVFSTATYPTYASITGNEWFAKIARARGFTVVPGAAVSRTSQPALFDLAFTESQRPRLLLAAPPEPDRQRYLLVSLVSPNNDLVLPPFVAGKEWFDAIWDTPWHRADASLPALWASALAPHQVMAWNNDTPGKSRTRRLRVVQITQKKHSVIINSNHRTDGVWVSWNNGANVQAIDAFSGANTVGPVLAGRLIDVAFGPSQAAAIHTKLTARENTEFTAQ